MLDNILFVILYTIYKNIIVIFFFHNFSIKDIQDQLFFRYENKKQKTNNQRNNQIKQIKQIIKSNNKIIKL